MVKYIKKIPMCLRLCTSLSVAICLLLPLAPASAMSDEELASLYVEGIYLNGTLLTPNEHYDPATLRIHDGYVESLPDGTYTIKLYLSNGTYTTENSFVIDRTREGDDWIRLAEEPDDDASGPVETIEPEAPSAAPAGVVLSRAQIPGRGRAEAERNPYAPFIIGGLAAGALLFLILLIKSLTQRKKPQPSPQTAPGDTAKAEKAVAKQIAPQRTIPQRGSSQRTIPQRPATQNKASAPVSRGNTRPRR